MVTYDGGIGIGQITGRTALSTAPGGVNATPNQILNHLWKLSSSMSYNVKIAVEVLTGKRGTNTGLFYQPIGNTSTSTKGGRSVLEHWYNALWSYNGTPDGYTAKSSAAPVYPDRVWSEIKKGGDGRWTFWKPAAPKLSSYAIESGYYIDGTSETGYTADKSPTLGKDGEKVAHADVDFDGVVDVVVSEPHFDQSGQNASVKVNVESDPDPNHKVSIISVFVSVDGAAREEMSAGAAVDTGGNTYERALTTPLHAGEHTFTFSVLMNVPLRADGSPARGNEADGITYSVNVPRR